MKKFENVPVVFGEHTRPTKSLSAEQLKTTGQPFASYGIAKGEVIEFPDSAADVIAREQPVRAGNPDGPAQRLIAVLRNGKPSWLSLGILNRTDYNRQPTCDFCAEMNDKANDWDRIESLFGKKITCTGVVEKPFQKFDRATGTRIEGQSELRPTPVIDYVA